MICLIIIIILCFEYYCSHLSENIAASLYRGGISLLGRSLYWGDLSIGENNILYESLHEKTNNVVSEQVTHKPHIAVTVDGWGLEILDLEIIGIVLSV